MSPTETPGAVDYLIACGLPAAAAERFAAVQATTDPATGTAAAIHAFEAWAADLVPERPGESDSARRDRGRAAVLLAGLPARWPGSFLAERVPAEAQAALAAAVLPMQHELEPARMSAPPLDLGPISDMADRTWRTFDTWPVLRGVVIWFLFLLLLGIVFYTVRL
ncbi:MAG TPA: hypothetical protein VL200_06550 [Lacunisphaera sp.]|jgi:hypothetical protein|nr:hypothetical protein [Lacunisphaera sp.]